MYTEAKLENDPFLIFSSDSGVSKVIAENSCYGAGELLVYEDILNKDDIFLDVGMNIGAISFQLKKRNPSLKIFGFEPVKEFYDLAVRNLSQFDDVNCFNIGLGSEEHTIGLPQFPITKVSNFGSTELRDAGDEYWVKVQRLDNVPELLGVLPKLVKIDVEGQEDLVIDGMEKLIHDNICISIEADRPDTVRNYLEFLRSHKFNLSFGSLQMTNIKSESRNRRYDRLSTVHIFAYYEQPSRYMNRMSTMSDFDEYYSFIKPMIERPRFTT